MNNQKEVVTYLLSKNANVTLKNSLGKNAAEEAFGYGYVEISEIINSKELENNKDAIKVEEINK